MIYITEMAFEDPDLLDAWHAFYLENIANLQSCPGFLASQRFESVVDVIAPFTAIHEIESPEVFTSDIYRKRGGRQSNGDWQPLMTHWHRNLYAGLDATPRVAPTAFLVYFDAPRAEAERELPLPSRASVNWLELVGLDRTIPHRGISVLDDASDQIAFARQDPRVKVFRPITEKISNGRPFHLY
ncbi:MAG TPA: hypothetical protein VGC69_09690, partial [Bordetella sp.]